MQSVHWDYADSFSGRDAAYLIAGFDPSSNGAEDTYKVQPIIKKLKKAYYFACSEIAENLRGDEYGEDSWKWLHRHKYDKTELLSVEIEEMLSNFLQSEFASKGHLENLEKADRQTSKDFPGYMIEVELESELEELGAALDKMAQEVDPQSFDLRAAAINKIGQLEEQHRDTSISWNAFYKARKELELERDALRDVIRQKCREIDPSYADSYHAVMDKLDMLRYEQSDWSDARSADRKALTDKSWTLYFAAVDEGNQWKAADSHEFDDQRFSRTELHRWITDNRLPSAYEFGDVKPIPCEVKIYPWGTHSTILLEHLSKAANKFWSNYDPTDFTTAPTNDQVEAWLVQQNVPKRTAEVMATILRADGLQTGRRR